MATVEERLATIEQVLVGIHETFKLHTTQDMQQFDNLKYELTSINTQLLDVRLHLARAEGEKASLKRVAGAISFVVSALISAAGILIKYNV
jgi:hypothetical protein